MITRRNIYDRTYKEVMEWYEKEKSMGNIRSPNYRENFPFALEQYLNHLKGD